ncbi:AAA family ATPase [Novosphingobium sp. 28-62-57]|uniref:AAA family ATPase n=1 Tax=Novosphingobium sp. 28-62-57 TaxID=1970409 RepID=UPI0025EA4CCF|nr:AAA family ATPase [Novosphingobium sp. 28-62-57]
MNGFGGGDLFGPGARFTAHQAVALAAANLGERQSVFAAAELEKEAGRYGLGRVTAAQISAAVARAQGDGALVPRTFLDKRGAKFAGFTTAENIAHERQLLRLEVEGRGSAGPILSAKQAASVVARAELQSDHPWNEGQRAATRALLTSPHRVTGLQGYAGTAKTTTVLATFAREAQARGVAVTALAPTASAAQTLGDALGQRGETVARQLVRNSASLSGGVWIVDEASLLSARDMAALLVLATDSKARVVLIGDVKQLGSVGAGAAFAQLQSAGMATARLDNVVRQTNTATREAVLASIEGDARKALDALERGGGRIIAHGSQGERFVAMAKAYTALDASERARTLVIEPSRDGRDALTANIRRELAAAGVLSGPAVTMESLVAKNLSRIEARDPASYAPGDTVRFLRDYADKGVTRGLAYQVERIDQEKAAISLKSADGAAVDWRLLVRFFARFGQHERSLFGFLLSNEPFGLQAFATRSVAPENWYRLDDLYDYVRACFGHRLAGASYRSHWLRIVSTIDTAVAASAFELKLLKAVAVLNLLDADDLIPTSRALAASFSPDEEKQVSAALDRLVKHGLLFHRGALGGYKLWPNASVNLEEALRQAERAIGPVRSTAAGLIPHLPADPIMARRHYLERGTLRYFERRYCEATDLAACAAKPTEADGLFIVVLSDDGAARSAVIDLAKKPGFAKRRDIVISFPPPVSSLASELADLRLWEWVSQNTAELADDSYARDEVSRQASLAGRALQGRMRTLEDGNEGPSGIFIWAGDEIARSDGERAVSALLSRVCDELYAAAPLITNELLNRNQVSSAAAAARMRLVERIFGSAELPDMGLPEAKAPPEKSIYLSIMKAGTLHVQTSTGFGLKFPGDKDPLNLRPALDALLASIAAGGGDRVGVASLIAELRAPPYGVRDGVAPLLLAFVLRTQPRCQGGPRD